MSPYGTIIYLLRLGIVRPGIRHRTRRCANRGNNVRIACAAANVAGETHSNLSIRSCTASYNKISPRYQHPGRAIAALQSMMRMKGLPQLRNNQIALEPFYGLHLSVMARNGKH
jgi:hypothetical protein